MITSMTAFARCSVEAAWGAATWELRTINHRYLEINLHLPEAVREMEGALREAVSRVLRRGRVDAHLKYIPAETNVAAGISVNTALLAQLSKAEREIEGAWGSALAPSSAIDLMKWPGILQAPSVDKAMLQMSVMTLFKEALDGVMSMRQREGQGLCRVIENRLVEVLQAVDKVKVRVPIVMQQQREKIARRIEELALSIEPKRLEEELLYLIQKMDVSEEIDRLQLHVQEVQQALQSGHPVGRRLDFLMQELNREANTLGSKSADTEVTHAAVHLKVLIEQIREQVQNIE
jgi:uncharacterized protein (TIGR00255 family)